MSTNPTPPMHRLGGGERPISQVSWDGAVALLAALDAMPPDPDARLDAVAVFADAACKTRWMLEKP